jgi:ABC-type methionine transport system ATPase subunit
VKDTAVYNEYTAGQAVAQSLKPANVKPSQITNLCVSTATLPEFNDKLAADDAGMGAIQRQRVAYGRGYASNCCPTCKKVLFADTCSCKLTVAQAAALKSVKTMFHTIEPNVRVT